MELAQHKQFTLAIKVQVYFCNPQSAWQRGTNENTNRLLRLYFPQGIEWYNQQRLHQALRYRSYV
jgi:IS30 family transposase